MEDMELTDYLLSIPRLKLPALIDSFQKLEANQEAIRSAMQSKVAEYRTGVEAQFDLVFRPGLLNL